MKWSGIILSLLVFFALIAGAAMAQESEEDIEKALKKLEEYYQKLRKELEAKLREKRGVKPTRTVKPVRAEGRPFLGMSLSPLPKGVRVLLNLGEGEGLVVKRVVQGGPADKVDIKPYDIILSFHGKEVGSLKGLKSILGSCRAGDEVRVLLLRDGRRMTVSLTLAGKKGAVKPEPKKPTRVRPEIEKFLDQTLRSRKRLITKYLRDLLGRNMELRLRARRFFDKLGAQDRNRRKQILKEIETVVEEMLGGLSSKEKAKLRAVFNEIIGGLRRSIEKTVRRSQKKEDIEAYLESLLGGKKALPKKTPKKDDIDKLIEDLLTDKDKKDGPKVEPKPGDKEEWSIPKEWEPMLKALLGPETWKRIQEMMKDPAMRDMVKNFLPKDFKFDAAGIRQLMKRFGVTEEELPGRLREMGLDDEAIKRILAKLNEGKKAPAKKGRLWVGVRASEIDQAQKERLGIAGGLVVTRVTRGGPADQAGILENDIILKANGTKVNTPGDFKAVLKGLAVGDSLRLSILRDGYKKVITFKLRAKK
jgi:hypothetical protein